MPVNPNDIEKTPDDESAHDPTVVRTCSFCNEFKNVRVTPDGNPTNPIGICNDCAIRAVVTMHNYLVQYSASLLRSNEALRRVAEAKGTIQ